MIPTEPTIAREKDSIKTREFRASVAPTLFAFCTLFFNGMALGETNTEDALLTLCANERPPTLSIQEAAGKSIEEEEKGDVEKAAKYALAAVCSKTTQESQDHRLVIFAYSNAIERLLEADKKIEEASAVLDASKRYLESNQPMDEQSDIRLKLSAARILSFQDKNAAALEVRESLRGRITALFGSESAVSIENELRIANLQIEAGKLEPGLASLDSLFQAAANSPSLGTRLRVAIFESYAIAFAISGQESRGFELLNLAKQKFGGDHGISGVREIDLDEEIASILFRQEKFDDALIIESSVFLKRDSLFPEQKVRLQSTLWRLASFYTSVQRVDTAKAILLNLKADLEKGSRTKSNQLLWQTLSRLASIDARGGNFVEASEKWRRVYEGEREILGDDGLDTQIELSNYATALAQSGETAIACPMLSRLLSRQNALRPDDLWATEFTKISLGRCLLRPGSSQDIERAKQLLSNAWFNLSTRAEESGPHELLAVSALAEADILSGRRTEAKSLLNDLVKSVEGFRDRGTPGLSARDSEFFVWINGLAANGDEVVGYRELALLHAQDEELERALRVSELARDRTLGDRFAEQEWLRDVVPAAERGELEPVLDRIQDLDERLAIAPDLITRVRLESERTLAVAQRGRVEQALRQRLHLEKPASVPPTLDDLREHLDARTALVSVVHSGDAWWALVVTRDAPARFVPLDDPDLGRNAAAWVRRLRGEPARAWPLAAGRLVIDDLRPAAAVGRFLSTDELGARLGRSLLDPLAAAVGTATHLVFVGDDELVGVPLQALPLGHGLAVDRFDITYAPSLTTYARWQARGAGGHTRDLLAIGAVDYPPRPQPGSDDTVAIGLAYAADHPLAYAREEVDAIAALFPAGRRRILSGGAARKSALRQASHSGELAAYRYVHLATHAWADPDQPEASAVVLSGDGSEAPLQVVLTAAELAGLRMGSDLIVLSACDTGAGHYEHGRGLLGLAYAALAAGNRAAILSLWSIADDTTATFMAHFYARLRRGREPATAMAQTQREFRESPDRRLSSPAAWAPFLVYGGY